MDKESDLVIFRGVLSDLHGKIRSVDGLFQLVNMGAYKLSLISPVNFGGSAVLVQSVKFVQRIGCQKSRKQGSQL